MRDGQGNAAPRMDRIRIAESPHATKSGDPLIMNTTKNGECVKEPYQTTRKDPDLDINACKLTIQSQGSFTSL